jgi:hypothetical protein
MKFASAIFFLLSISLADEDAAQFKITKISLYPFSYNVVSVYSGQTMGVRWANGIIIKWSNSGFSGYDIYIGNDLVKTVSSRKCFKKSCSTKLLVKDENGLPEDGLDLSSGQYGFKVCRIDDSTVCTPIKTFVYDEIEE